MGKPHKKQVDVDALARQVESLTSAFQSMQTAGAEEHAQRLVEEFTIWTLKVQQAAGDVDREYQHAINFTVTQFVNRSVLFGYAQRAITLACDNYHGILDAASSKRIDWSAALFFVGMAVVPEVAAFGGILNATFKDQTARYVGALKVVGKVLDIRKAALRPSKTSADDVAGGVLESVYDGVLRQMALEALLLQQVTTALLDGSVRQSPMSTVQTFFNQAGLQRVDAQPPVALEQQSNTLADMILYDMLAAYTKAYISVEIDAPERDPLDAIADNLVSIDGFNGDQLSKIYAKFRRLPAFWIHSMRREVADWDDLVHVWRAPLTYRPGRHHTWNKPGELNTVAKRAKAQGLYGVTTR